MRLYILNIKPSTKAVSETKLTRDNIWLDESGFYPDETAYEMCVDVYNIIIDGVFIASPQTKEKTVIIGAEFYKEILEKYSHQELIQGVKIDSLVSIINTLHLDKDILFEEEVAAISKSIVDLKKYAASDDELLRIVHKEIMQLKDKFKIQPK